MISGIVDICLEVITHLLKKTLSLIFPDVALLDSIIPRQVTTSSKAFFANGNYFLALVFSLIKGFIL